MRLLVVLFGLIAIVLLCFALQTTETQNDSKSMRTSDDSGGQIIEFEKMADSDFSGEAMYKSAIKTNESKGTIKALVFDPLEIPALKEKVGLHKVLVDSEGGIIGSYEFGFLMKPDTTTVWASRLLVVLEKMVFVPEINEECTVGYLIPEKADRKIRKLQLQTDPTCKQHKLTIRENEIVILPVF